MGTPSKYRVVPSDCITLAPRGWAAKRAARRVIAAAGLIVATLALAPTGETRQFTSGVNLVEVYASVTDARGESVTGLTQQDFGGGCTGPEFQYVGAPARGREDRGA